MYVHGGLRELVAEGKLGAKTGGDGFYNDGDARLPGDNEPDLGELADRFNLKALVEACLLVEEGVVSTKDADLGMMAGAGLDPAARSPAPTRPGLDEVVRKLETAAEDWGERFAPPLLLRRLANQGRTGLKAGRASSPTSARRGRLRPGRHGDARDARGRRDRMARQPADERAVAERRRGPAARVEPRPRRRHVPRARSSPRQPAGLLRRRRHQGVHAARREQRGTSSSAARTGLLREMERSGIATIAAVNAIAFGGGCEIAMGCDVRIAAQSALFGQPEINLGIMPGLGGTQRLPRLVGTNKALEMNLTGDPISADEAYEFGLVNRVVPDHELLDTALAWARKLAGQAPLSVQRIKRVTADPALDAGIQAEIEAFVESLSSEDGREGVAAFLEKRQPQWRGA
jgi:enoyl-CoA hydratase/3-hydroxyacyl-CoA dehydrogenase